VPKKAPLVEMRDDLKIVAGGVQQLLEAHAEGQAFVTVVEDFQKTMIEALQVLDSQGQDLLAHLDRLNQRGAAQQHLGTTPHTLRQRAQWAWAGAGVVAGVLLMAGVWWSWPVSPTVKLLMDIDQVLERNIAQVPKPLQERLAELYKARGFVPPTGKRQVTP
jgi:hypothetical protein